MTEKSRVLSTQQAKITLLRRNILFMSLNILIVRNKQLIKTLHFMTVDHERYLLKVKKCLKSSRLDAKNKLNRQSHRHGGAEEIGRKTWIN